ncbi:MAG: amino acid adenylation domain-containing protein [Bacteroidetes bacterium]|nr:amino acid adenylation domain-containing protein [Bacteroidota bacterium]
MKELFEKLRSYDIHVSVSGDNLRISGKQEIPAELLAELKARKEMVLTYLRQRAFDRGESAPIEKVAFSPTGYILSSSQMRIWILSQFEESNRAYNMPETYLIRGMLDPAMLEKSFFLTIDRYEILHTVFIEEKDGQVYQQIRNVTDTGFKLVFEDLSKDPDKMEKVKGYIRENTQQLFDLSKGPLVRASLYKLDSDEWVLNYVMHHIISDGWSMEILMQELMRNYIGINNNETSPVIPLRIQYKDYAAWQQKQPYSAAMDENKKYWLDFLGGELPVLQLPGSGLRPLIRTYNGAVHSFIFDLNSSQAFKNLCNNQGATLFMGLLTVVNIVLGRYSGQNDILTGTPVAGRNHPDTENQIGFFLNTLIMRVKTDPEDSFVHLLGKVKAGTLGAFEHQQYPFDRLVEDLDPVRDPSRSPLFDVMVILQNARPVSSDALQQHLPFSLSRMAEEGDIRTKFDLTFSFAERNNELHLALEFNTDLFERKFAERLAEHVQLILQGCTARPDAPVLALDILSNTERRQVITAFNNTGTSYPQDKSVIDLFDESTLKYPDHIAVSDSNQCLTYHQLHQLSVSIAENISAVAGDNQDEPIAFFLPRSCYTSAVILGILRAGRPFIALDITFPAERLNYIFAHSECRIVIAKDEMPVGIHTTRVAIYKLEEIVSTPQEPVKKGTPPSPADAAYFIYTSGSTGQPKGIRIPHKAVVNFLCSMQKQPGIREKDLLYAVTTCSFDISVLELLLPLMSGAKVYIASDSTLKNPEKIIEELTLVKPCILQATPAFYQWLLDAGWKCPPSLRVFCGGETMSQQVAEKIINTGAELWNMYGPSETTVYSVIKRMNHPGQNTIIGTPVHNTQVYILNDRLLPQPVYVPGNIYIGGEGLALGYHQDPLQTRERFIAHPFEPGKIFYDTGDTGRWLPDGDIEFLGRRDTQLKIRGYRIEAGEIENALLGCTGVESCVVAGIDSPSGEKELVAYLTSSGKLVEQEMRANLARKLPTYMLPAHYMQLDVLPKTPSGKIDRKSLPAPVGSGISRSGEFVQAKTAMQSVMVSLWQELLGRDQVSAHDNFFELGGNSIKIIRLANAIRRETGVKPELSALFSHPILSDQASILDEILQQPSSQVVTIPRLEKRGRFRMSSSQRRLWVLSQFPQNNAAYNMPGVYELEGQPDVSRLQQSFVELIDRHEILRTVFIEVSEGIVEQVVKENTGFSMEVNDYRFAEKVDQAFLHERIAGSLTEPFDLSEGPLLRSAIYLLPGGRCILTYLMHHIISDGWSMGILLRELLHFYNRSQRNTSVGLPALRIQYGDYAEWQQQGLSDGSLEASHIYWKNVLGGKLPVLELPGDRVRPAVKTCNGGRVIHQVETEELSLLLSLLKTEGCTLFMGLVSLVNALLYRYTDQEDIIVGTPVAGREQCDLEDQLGFYVNTLSLRTKFSGMEGYRKLLANVKEVLLGAYDHQSYPFDELVEEFYKEVDISRNPMFDVAVVLQNTEQKKKLNEVAETGGIRVRNYEAVERRTSLFDLRFEFIEVEEGLSLQLEYNSDIFNKDSIERMIQVFSSLIKAVTTAPDTAIGELNILQSQEAVFSGLDLLGVTYPHNETIVTLFEKQVYALPENTAVISGEERITYDDLNRQANRIARFLLNTVNIAPEDGVGLLLDRSCHCIAAILGTVKARCMYVPMDASTPENRLRFMIKDGEVKVLITESRYIELANRLQWSASCLKNYICLDSINVFEEAEQVENLMMNAELWDHVGEKALDQVTGGGWSSSFTGLPIPLDEMEEYAMNAYRKISPMINDKSRVLEIGCSSGLTLLKIAPEAGYYLGTDLSPVIINNTSAIVASFGFANVKLLNVVADNILSVGEADFNMVIMNSVIQHFHGHNYLRKVIKDAISLLADDGCIFIGDVMDIDMKDAMIADLEDFKETNRGKGYLTKTDFSAELFVSKGFFQDLMWDEDTIAEVEISDKIFTISNELTRYRYDVIIRVNKKKPKRALPLPARNRMQYDWQAIELQADHNPGLGNLPTDPAYVIYTSGTTGKPKGVVISHQNVVRLFVNDLPLFRFTEDDVWTMFHSYSFDFSVWEMYGALFHGGKLVLISNVIARDPESFLTLMRKEQVTILNQTPSSFYNLIRQELEMEDNDLCLRYIIFGGEALAPSRLAPWLLKYPEAEFINMYGITETTVHVTYKKITPEEIEQNISNIGRPIPTLACYVLNQHRQKVPAGVPGELYVGGAGVSSGYLHREQLNAEKFLISPFDNITRLYRSGDKARVLPNGDLEYLGRIDQQVKIRGYRMELGEIENALKRNNAIEEAFVLAKNMSSGDKELIAYILCKYELQIKDIRDFLRMHLPEQMIPAYFIRLDKLPLTSNGKLDKNRLPDPIELSMHGSQHYRAPVTSTEKYLAEVWSELLEIGAGRIGLDDNFFELGGHSLRATRLAFRIKKDFVIPYSIRNVFQHPTITTMALEIENLQWLNRRGGAPEPESDVEKFVF